MSRGMSGKKWWAGALVAALGLVLAGCVLVPGRFGADLSVRRDGTFGFGYKGEIYVLALSKAADKGVQPAFEPTPCYDDSMDERPCSGAEIDKQRAEWKDGAEKRKADTAGQQQAIKAMLGGIDPSDPKAAQEFADRLMRQQGWKSVVSRGDGRFDVVYEIAGRLDHDFIFPTIERFPVMTPFVTVMRRADGSVRIDAPAFAAGAGVSPMMGMGMLGGVAATGASATGEQGATGTKSEMSGAPVLDGTFVLHTDGDILANNTDEGPKPEGTAKRLDWKIDARTAAAPTALVRLGR